MNSEENGQHFHKSPPQLHKCQLWIHYHSNCPCNKFSSCYCFAIYACYKLLSFKDRFYKFKGKNTSIKGKYMRSGLVVLSCKLKKMHSWSTMKFFPVEFEKKGIYLLIKLVPFLDQNICSTSDTLFFSNHAYDFLRNLPFCCICTLQEDLSILTGS